MSHFVSLTASLPFVTVNRIGSRLAMSYVLIAFLIAALLDLDGLWSFVAVLFAAFLIYLFH